MRQGHIVSTTVCMYELPRTTIVAVLLAFALCSLVCVELRGDCKEMVEPESRAGYAAALSESDTKHYSTIEWEHAVN